MKPLIDYYLCNYYVFEITNKRITYKISPTLLEVIDKRGQEKTYLECDIMKPNGDCTHLIVDGQMKDLHLVKFLINNNMKYFKGGKANGTN